MPSHEDGFERGEHDDDDDEASRCLYQLLKHLLKHNNGYLLSELLFHSALLGRETAEKLNRPQKVEESIIVRVGPNPLESRGPSTSGSCNRLQTYLFSSSRAVGSSVLAARQKQADGQAEGCR